MSWHASLSRNHLFDLMYLVSRDVADLSVHHLDLIVHGTCSIFNSRITNLTQLQALTGWRLFADSPKK